MILYKKKIFHLFYQLEKQHFFIFLKKNLCLKQTLSLKC